MFQKTFSNVPLIKKEHFVPWFTADKNEKARIIRI
jgi:hypothetical protein